MAKARAIIKRRKSVQNIRKITRTMELIATARFKKALDRATEAEAYTRKIAEIVADLGTTGAAASHPLLQAHEPVKNARSLILTSNRGLAGGYNGNVLRLSTRAYQQSQVDGVTCRWTSPASEDRLRRFRGFPANSTHTHFEDRPQFDEVEVLANEYIQLYVSGQIDRLDVAYTRFISSARQEATVQTLLPMTSVQVEQAAARKQERQARRTHPVRVPARRREHPQRDRAGLVQGATLQMLPRRRRERADRADGGHARRDRKRRRHGQVAHHALQPGQTGADHPRACRDHRRRRGPRINHTSNRSIIDGHRDRDGQDRAGDRLDLRRRVRAGPPARDLQRPDDRHRGKRRQDSPHRRGPAAPRRQPRAMRRPGLDRRIGPGHGRPRHRRARHGPRGQGDVGPRVQPAGPTRSTAAAPSTPRKSGPSTATPPRSTSSRPRPRSSRPASRSSTC